MVGGNSGPLQTVRSIISALSVPPDEIVYDRDDWRRLSTVGCYSQSTIVALADVMSGRSLKWIEKNARWLSSGFSKSSLCFTAHIFLIPIVSLNVDL
jgi:hypothetical protein